MGLNVAKAKEVFLSNKLDVILRCADWLWSLVVFSTIADQLIDVNHYYSNTDCWFGYEKFADGGQESSDSTCNFGIFMGVVSWLIDMVLLIYIFLPAIRADGQRPDPVWFDGVHFGSHALFLFLWIVNAFNMSIQYTATCTTYRDMFSKNCSSAINHSAAFAVTFFSWFAAFLWAIATVRSLHKWQSPSSSSSSSSPSSSSSSSHERQLSDGGGLSHRRIHDEDEDFGGAFASHDYHHDNNNNNHNNDDDANNNYINNNNDDNNYTHNHDADNYHHQREGFADYDYEGATGEMRTINMADLHNTGVNTQYRDTDEFDDLMR